MESIQERKNAKKTNNNKAHIDFYRASQINVEDLSEEDTEQDFRDKDYEVDDNQLQLEKMKINSNKNNQVISDKNDLQVISYDDKQRNYNTKNSSHNRKHSQENHTKKVQQINKKDVENKKVIENNPRNLGGSKSSMDNQGNNKIQNANNKIKMELQQNQDYQQYKGQNNQELQKGLVKSQSQNRLLFTSPESIQNKNCENQTGKNGQNKQDKISFFKDQNQPNKRGSTSSGQELLFKQHHQYSTANGQHKSQQQYQIKQSNHHVLSHCSTKECTFCKTQGVHSNIIGANSCSAIYCKQNQIGIMMQNNLSKRYSTNRDYYNVKIINDLIYNENTHVVSIFKDYLILDDINEFLKRSYNYQETKVRLPKLCSFYDKYSQVFPNFVVLPESKYMFKNIQRKQKLIDEQYQIQEQNAQRQQQTLIDEDRLFNSKFYNSVYKMDLSMSRQQYEDQAKQISVQAGKNPNKGLFGRIEEMKIEDLVDRFLVKDSESNIQLMTTAGLDFSGLTQQSVIANEKTPRKSDQQQKMQTKQLMNYQQKTGKDQNQKKSLPNSKRPTNYLGNTNSQQNNNQSNTKKQRQSNSKGKSQNNEKWAQQINGSNSKNTTPRLNKKQEYTNYDQQKQVVQASPGTQEAIASYLQHCQIDLCADQQKPSIEILDSVKQISKGLKNQSPSFKSPNAHTFNNLHPSQSQTSLAQQNRNITSSMNINRQAMKSQQQLNPTSQIGKNQPINNAKKTKRLSSGQYKSNNRKNMVSPTAQQPLSKQNPGPNSSRNIPNSQSQKNIQAINSHAKYLSGGSDQQQNVQPSGNAYTTQETIQKNKEPKLSEGIYKINEQSEFNQNDYITVDDAEEAAIADERLTSPEVCITDDIMRKSKDKKQPSQQFYQEMLTSQDDKMMLSQYSNYDQIKKHLEKFIYTNQKTNENYNSLQGVNKKISLAKTSDNRKPEKNNQFVQSSNGTNYNDINNSRNQKSQYQFESMKSKIRGVFDNCETTSQCSNKTPIKGSVYSNQVQNNNRMSIESKDVMPNRNQIQGCLSSTSANQKMLPFQQNLQPSNYRSTTNLQQRKGSKTKENTSNDNKRNSYNKQSFKDIQNKVHQSMKRCATGKTLSINENHQQTFGPQQKNGGLNSIPSATTLLNPTFINKQSNQRVNSSQGIQQQAANTVRVMTPSYSLASLSKMITPTTQTSPMTMTVTLAGSGQQKKQVSSLTKKNNGQSMQSQQSNSTQNKLQNSHSQQTFLVNDKNKKVISKQKGNFKSNQHATNTKSRYVGDSNNNQSGTTSTITPRAQQRIHQQIEQNRQQIADQVIAENSQSLSCTISTENNSAAKTLESKNPKFMKTIEEFSGQKKSNQLGYKKQGYGSSVTSSQGNLDSKQKSKIQTANNSNQASQKRLTGSSLMSSGSISHFKSPSQQLQSKKALQGKYQHF